MKNAHRDYQDSLQRSVLSALLRASAVEIEGKMGADLDPIAIAAVLTNITAQFLAVHANAEGGMSREDVRDFGIEYGCVLAVKMQAILDSGSVIPAYCFSFFLFIPK